MSPTDNQWIRFEYKSYINGPVSSVSEIGKYRLKAEKVETDFVQNVYISDKAEVGNVMHELMHVLGFMHEQQRDDRDTYVAIDVEFKKNVNYKKEAISVPPEAPYDIYSIMHYSLCDKVITFRHAYIEWLKSTVFPGTIYCALA
jgi:hypothetical protein